MGLTLANTPKQKKHRMDVVAIPAIGADPETTWRYPHSHTKPPQFIWNDLKNTRVYLYKFDHPEGQQEYGITHYADDLLDALAARPEIGKRAIHFAAHSTGGLVLKRALILALGKFGDQGRYKQILRNCSSIAFFGTPHCGSTILSEPTYRDAVQQELQLDKPLGNRLRSQLEQVENLDELRHFSLAFQPLTLGMKKIWSFSEFRESHMKVKVVVPGPGRSKRTTSTTVKSAIVDKRSATMTDDGFLIGCEEAVPVDATHASLPRFGDNPRAKEFAYYINVLQTLVDCAFADQSPEDEEKCRAIIEKEVRAEVHQFYDLDGVGGSEPVRLWSVNPSLEEFFKNGPSSFLLKRSELAKKPSTEEDLSQAATSNGMHTSTDAGQLTPAPAGGQAMGSTTKRGPSNSDDSRSGYHIPDLNQYLFRWIHIPANNMSWVEKTLRTIEKEVAIEEFREAGEYPASGTFGDSPVETAIETPISEPEKQTAEVLENPIANPALSQLLKGAVVLERKEGNLKVNDILTEAVQNPTQAKDLLQASQLEDPRRPTQLSEMPAIVDDIREQASMLKTAVLLEKKNKARKTKITTENFVAALNKAVLAVREKPSLAATLLHPRVWNLLQFTPNHERPHGRFMVPGLHAFYPESKIEKDPGGPPRLYSATDTAQFSLYFPYLHWDTFGCMKERTKLINRRITNGLDFKPNSEILQGYSMEKKLIWQYLFNSANLPLHIRRTLDQFGYPNLENTWERDCDQVAFKWAKDANERVKKAEEARSEMLKKRQKNDSGAGAGAGVPCNTLLQTRPSIGANMTIIDEDGYKVLMVDQLWCWIINDTTITTFFPAKEETYGRYQETPGSRNQRLASVDGHTDTTEEDEEEESPIASHKPPSRTVFSPADLRDDIYDDMNGDPLFQDKDDSQCKDCLDFMARAVWHAVSLFLDTEPGCDPPANDLRIFQIFEERICDLTEKCAEAFKKLRQVEQNYSRDMEIADTDKAAKKLLLAVRALNNSDDLQNLLEVHDVKDELGTLMKLFKQQIKVIDQMIKAYQRVDDQEGKPEAHVRARGWLHRTKNKVEGYIQKSEDLLNECKKAEENYDHLLDMKQKKANVVEASCARISSQMATRQGYAMMTFTIVTVLFLPLSFFTSLFGMNVRDWTGDPANSTLQKVMMLMGSISAAIIVIALMAAFFPLWIGSQARNLKGKFGQAKTKSKTMTAKWRGTSVKEESSEEDASSTEGRDEREEVEVEVVDEAEGEGRRKGWVWRRVGLAVRRKGGSPA